jgi:hypothetical protein
MEATKTPGYFPDDELFNMAPLPENFVLADMEHYPDLPPGLCELSMVGPVMHPRQISLSCTGDKRTFLFKERDGAAALVRLKKGGIDVDVLQDYLASYARYATGFLIREIGLLGAALYDMVCAYHHQSETTLIARHVAGDCPPRVGGKPVAAHPLLEKVIFIEVEGELPTEDTLVEERSLDYWASWRDAKKNIHQWIANGGLPLGISVYRPSLPGEPFTVQTLRNSNNSLSINDTIIVVSPGGTVCMMCLDTQNSVGRGEGPPAGDVLNWLEYYYPRSVKASLSAMTREWSLLEPLFYHLAEKLVDDSRAGRLGGGWRIPQLPAIKYGDAYYPVILDNIVVEPSFSALQLCQLSGPA